MFCLNEKVVYPGHGVAHINRIITKIVSGQEALFYELLFVSKGITILVPTNNAEVAGIRKISSREKIDQAFLILSQPYKNIFNAEYTTYSWNKRSKEYQRKLTSGNIEDLLGIYRDLRYIETQKELSFGERNILNQAETLLVEEIALAQKIESSKVVEDLKAMCASNVAHNGTKIRETGFYY